MNDKKTIDSKAKELFLDLLERCALFYENNLEIQKEINLQAIFFVAITNFIINIWEAHQKTLNVKDFQEFLGVFEICYKKQKEIENEK